MKWNIPLADVSLGTEEYIAVHEVLDSGWLTMGAVTRQFEEEFAAYCGVKHALAVTNATAALHLVCQAIGLGPGDEVILPSLTFVATANAVRYTGATPVFADISSLEDLTLSPQAVEAAITPRTKAIMVMHYGGYACDMPVLMEIARRHNLPVLEDAAHAIGSSLDGRQLGTMGIAGCFSFFPNKNMTTGEGGMVITDDDVLAEKVRLLRSHGMTSLTWDRHEGHAQSYDVVDLGYNYRIDELRSALGRVQLAKLDSGNARRREITALYRELLAELAPSVIIPFQDHPGTSACHIMPVILPTGTDRTAFINFLKDAGIQTSIHYPPIHTFSAYQKLYGQVPNLPLSEDAASREVTLPLYPGMTDDQVLLVVRAIQNAQKTS